MRGHEPLIAMRRSGRRVAAVWFDMDGTGDDWRTWPQALGVEWKRFPNKGGDAHVQVQRDDSIPRLDLRFVMGLQAWVSGFDERRVRQLHEACAAAGASRVLSTLFRMDAKGTPRTALMLDTAGLVEGVF